MDYYFKEIENIRLTISRDDFRLIIKLIDYIKSCALVTLYN